MSVLAWLVPPLVATGLAMLWAAWAGRDREEVKRDDSEAAMARMKKALDRPTPRRGKPVVSRPEEPSHGVAIRGLTRSPSAGPRPSR
jgi:hypothetical protein